MRAPFHTLIILYRIDKKEILYGIFLRKKRENERLKNSL